MVHLVATSDIHGNLPSIPPCDLLIIAGDICPGSPIESQARWLDTQFRRWLESLSYKKMIAIAGNHDKIFERAEGLVPKMLPWHYLQDSEVELFGYKFYGTPWQLPFWGAFNQKEKLLHEIYQKIPTDTDVLISHGPPYGIGDQVNGIHTGSISLRKRIEEIKPKLVLFGHIHPGFGQWELDGITYANVSLLNDQMQIVNSPLEFYLA